MQARVRGQQQEGSGGRRARPQEAPLPLRARQAGDQDHGVLQGVSEDLQP